MNACSQKEIALRWPRLPSRKPRDEEQSGGGIKVGDEAELFKGVQTTPGHAHQAQRSSSVQIASHGREGSQAAVKTTIKWHLMKKCQINRSREVRHQLPHRPCQKSTGMSDRPTGLGRPFLRGRFLRGDCDAQKMMCSNNERLKKSRGIEMELDGSQKRRVSLARDSFIRIAVRRTAAMSVNSDAVVQSGQSLRRGRHAVGRVSCARPVTMCRVAWRRRPGLQQLAVRQGTGTIVRGSFDSRRLPDASVIVRIIRMWPGERARGFIILTGCIGVSLAVSACLSCCRGP